MSEIKYIACIDVGTTGCRTIIFSSRGRVMSEAYEEYVSIFLSPTWIDHDPSTWIKATRNTLQKAIKLFPGETGAIAAICVISQRSTFIPVDADGIPLDNAILWQDKRATAQADFIRGELGAEHVYHKTGLRIDPYFSLPKLLWLKENKPHVFKDAHKILTVHDLIIHQLTGEFITDWTQAARTMLFNINELSWDEQLCEHFGIPMDKLARAVPSGTIVGALKKTLQSELNLRPDIPVVSVGGDQQAAAVGLGIVTPGLMCVNTGTGSFILAHAERPAFDPQQRVVCTASAVAGKWLVEAGIYTSGSVYRWFRDNFAMIESNTARDLQIDAYEILNSEIKNTSPGAGGMLLLPHFAGSAAPYWNPEAVGLLFGCTLGHKRSHVIRGLLEGICFEIYKNIHIIESLTTEITEIRVSGGATRSTTFNQIQSDVYGKTVLRGISEQSSALGAMLVAATAIGLYPDIPAAVSSAVAFDGHNRRSPDEDTHRLYGKMLALHDDIYHALASHNIYEKAHELREELRKSAS
ncbi:MAG: carbohydrate kinase [Desulfuromonadales bacterium]|nr:carbohydrate kinase [Desulfuromonadales bacterium]